MITIHWNANELLARIDYESLDDLRQRAERAGLALEDALTTLVAAKYSSRGLYGIGHIDHEDNYILFTAISGYPMTAVPAIDRRLSDTLKALGLTLEDIRIKDHTNPTPTDHRDMAVPRLFALTGA